jgi:hypothetical protein
MEKIHYLSNKQEYFGKFLEHTRNRTMWQNKVAFNIIAPFFRVQINKFKQSLNQNLIKLKPFLFTDLMGKHID